MIVGGFYKPTEGGTASVQTKKAINAVAAGQGKTVVLKKNEIIVTITPAQDSALSHKEELTPITLNTPPSTNAETEQNKKPNLFSALYSIIRSILNK